MGNFFGVRRRAPAITAQDRSILQLKNQRDRIKIFQRKVDSDIKNNKELALKLYDNGMKDRALLILRRAKFLEETISRTDKQLETLESLVADIEYTQIEVSVVEGLKVGSEALKQLNSLMNLDDIQKIMEDNEEAAEKQKEISNLLSKTSERFDQDELLSELEQISNIESNKDDQVVDLQDLPQVPTEVGEPTKTVEQDELPTELEAEQSTDDSKPVKVKRKETRQLVSE